MGQAQSTGQSARSGDTFEAYYANEKKVAFQALPAQAQLSQLSKMVASVTDTLQASVVLMYLYFLKIDNIDPNDQATKTCFNALLKNDILYRDFVTHFGIPKAVQKNKDALQDDADYFIAVLKLKDAYSDPSLFRNNLQGMVDANVHYSGLNAVPANDFTVGLIGLKQREEIFCSDLLRTTGKKVLYFPPDFHQTVWQEALYKKWVFDQSDLEIAYVHQATTDELITFVSESGEFDFQQFLKTIYGEEGFLSYFEKNPGKFLLVLPHNPSNDYLKLYSALANCSISIVLLASSKSDSINETVFTPYAFNGYSPETARALTGFSGEIEKPVRCALANIKLFKILVDGDLGEQDNVQATIPDLCFSVIKYCIEKKAGMSFGETFKTLANAVGQVWSSSPEDILTVPKGIAPQVLTAFRNMGLVKKEGGQSVFCDRNIPYLLAGYQFGQTLLEAHGKKNAKGKPAMESVNIPDDVFQNVMQSSSQAFVLPFVIWYLVYKKKYDFQNDPVSNTVLTQLLPDTKSALLAVCSEAFSEAEMLFFLNMCPEYIAWLPDDVIQVYYKQLDQFGSYSSTPKSAASRSVPGTPPKSTPRPTGVDQATMLKRLQRDHLAEDSRLDTTDIQAWLGLIVERDLGGFLETEVSNGTGGSVFEKTNVLRRQQVLDTTQPDNDSCYVAILAPVETAARVARIDGAQASKNAIDCGLNYKARPDDGITKYLIALSSDFDRLKSLEEDSLKVEIVQLLQNAGYDDMVDDDAIVFIQGKIREADSKERFDQAAKDIQGLDARDVFTELNETTDFFKVSQSAAKLLMPFNLGDIHWTSVEIFIAKTDACFNCYVFFYDPYYPASERQKSNPPLLEAKQFRLIEQALTMRLKDYCADAQIHIENSAHDYKQARQASDDGLHCADYARNDIITRAMGRPLIPYEKTNVALREELVKDFEFADQAVYGKLAQTNRSRLSKLQGVQTKPASTDSFVDPLGATNMTLDEPDDPPFPVESSDNAPHFG